MKNKWIKILDDQSYSNSGCVLLEGDNLWHAYINNNLKKDIGQFEARIDAQIAIDNYIRNNK